MQHIPRRGSLARYEDIGRVAVNVEIDEVMGEHGDVYHREGEGCERYDL